MSIKATSNELNNLILQKQTQARPVSLQTLDKYIKQYEFLTASFNKSGDWVSNSTETQLINIIKKMDIKTAGQMNYLNIFFMIKTINEQPTQEILKFRESLFKKKDKQTEQKIQEKQTQNLPSYSVVEAFINNLYKDGDFIRYLYNYLIFTYGLRNKDINLSIIQADKFNKLDDKQKQGHNLLVVKKTECELIIDDYKTRNTYGTKNIKIRSRKILKVCQSLKDGPILVKSNGSNVSNDELGYYIRLFQNEEFHLTEADYFKINVLYIQTQPNPLKKLQEIAKMRGTQSITNLNQYYNLSDE
jgi:hypothetical protein